MGNEYLMRASKAKNDEFYTQYDDVERELDCYVEFDHDVFRGKVVMCPCDDPRKSMFVRYFIIHFKRFGLRRLICTCRVLYDSKEVSLFEDSDVQGTRGKGLLLDVNVDTIDSILSHMDSIPCGNLVGDGDFRSAEVTALRDDSDFIITNPPFSLFHVFLCWIRSGGKKFIIMGFQDGLRQKVVFNLFLSGGIWLGNTFGGREFTTPSGEKKKVNNVYWFTNVRHADLTERLECHTMEENRKKFAGVVGKEYAYVKYDNYDAIEIPSIDMIPSDYDGLMGVPLNFMDKWNPKQFSIIGICKPWGGMATKRYARQRQINTDGKSIMCKKLNDSAVIRVDGEVRKNTYYVLDGIKYISLYGRILIRRIVECDNKVES